MGGIFAGNTCTMRFVYCLLGVVLALSSPAQTTYNFYFGNIHSHTAYSDGNKEGSSLYDTPYESFWYARNSLNFHFLGISEHNHAGAGMSLANYFPGLVQADSANADGNFVAMYGMEWGTISQGGHVIIYGYDSLIGWETGNYHIYNAVDNYNGLFSKVASKAGAFAYLAHPEVNDYDSLLLKPYSQVNDNAIVGMAIRSGPAFSTDTTYSNNSTSSYLARYKDALKLGYHVGAGLDHDNHYTTFGRMADSRMVVLAPSLTRANILDGIRNSRTYASDDWNVQVNFTIDNTYYMGAQASAESNPVINVSVVDPDGEGVSYIYLKYGVPGSGANPVNLTSVSGNTTLTYTHSISTGSTFYYYLEIKQPDNDMIYSSPIWFTKTAPLPILLTSFSAKAEDHRIAVQWETASEVNVSHFTVEKFIDNDFENIREVAQVAPEGEGGFGSRYKLYDQDITGNVSYYRLKETDTDGTIFYSNLVAVQNPEPKYVAETLSNPWEEEVYLSVNSPGDDIAELAIYDLLGKQRYCHQLWLNKGDNFYTIPTSSLPAGIYILQLVNTQRTLVSSRIMTY